MDHRRSRSALAIVFVSLSAPAWSAFGQADGGKQGDVTILPGWKVGERLRYERVKTRRKTAAGKETFKGTGRGPIDVAVIEAGAKGYLVRWRIGEMTADDPQQANDPTVRAMSRLIQGLDIDIELDPEATLTGVRNWSAVKTAGTKVADTVIAEVAKQAHQAGKDDPKLLAGLRSTLDSMLATKAQIEQLFLREPEVLFFPIGRTYPGIGKAFEYDDQLPNPLGGPSFPCKGAFTLTAYDAAKGRAAVTWTQTPDPHQSARIINETLMAISKRMGRTPPNADALKSLSINDRAEFVINTKSGWVENFTQIRSVTSEGNTQEDILSMILQTKLK
jgi:hypothetical protein